MNKSKTEIIEELAKEKTVETIINNITHSNNDILNDLAQDIYIDLLNKEDELIIELYNNNQIKFFITRMVMNNWFSQNSPFYMKYRKFSIMTDQYDTDDQDTVEGDNDRV